MQCTIQLHEIEYVSVRLVRPESSFVGSRVRTDLLSPRAFNYSSSHKSALRIRTEYWVSTLGVYIRTSLTQHNTTPI